MKVDKIIIDIKGNINDFKNSLIKYFTEYQGYKVEYTTDDRKFKEADKVITKTVHLLNIEDIDKDKKALITLIPGDNTIKIVITGENKNPLKNKINDIINKSSKFNKVEDKIKESKLKEIIRKYVKEAIQRI